MSALKPPQPPDYSKPPDAEDPELANWLMGRTPFQRFERLARALVAVPKRRKRSKTPRS